MHRRSFLLKGAALAGSGFIFSSSHAAPQHTLTLGHQFPAGSVPDRIANQFADQVAQHSAGQISVRVFNNATFGDEREHLSLLRRGSLDLAITGDLVISSLDPMFLVVNLPFIYRDPAHALATYNGSVGERMRAHMKDLGLNALSWHYTGTRMLTANAPLKNTASLKGIRLRLPSDTTWIRVWRALGATPVEIPFPDLATALKLGRVDAQENPPNFVRNGQLHTEQTHLMTTRHMPQRQFVFMAQNRWVALPDDTRTLLAQAAHEASAWGSRLAREENDRDLEWLTRDGGLARVEFNAEGTEKITRTIARQLGGPEGENVYQSIVAQQ